MPCESAIPLSLNAHVCTPEIGARKVNEPHNENPNSYQVETVLKLLWDIPQVGHWKSKEIIRLLLLTLWVDCRNIMLSKMSKRDTFYINIYDM